MYVGNGLISIGMTMLLGSPMGYLILIPFFLFVYQAIVAAEEAYLRKKFIAFWKHATFQGFLQIVNSLL